MIVENRRARAHVDVPLILMAYALALFGVLAVTVATYSISSTADAPLLNHIVESDSAVRQCLFLLIGAVVISVLINIPYDVLKRFTPMAYYGANILLLVVWVFNRAEGVKQWLDVIWGFTIQPSEFAKLAMILMMARTLSRSDKPMSNIQEGIYIFTLLGIPAAINLFSGEMGSLLVIVFVFAVMLYFSGVDIRILLALAAIAIVAVLGLYAFMRTFNPDSYRLARILSFIDPENYSTDAAYQQTQSKIAIGSGGLWGIGMFVDGAMSQLNYVPADWTDFIFATIGEAFGFVGCVAIIVVYLAILLRMLYLARFTKDRYGMLVIIGVMGMLLFHVFENIAMTIGLMPITGIPLPFISYGGSNMVANMGGIALVLNVTKNRSLAGSIATPQREAALLRYRNR